MGHNCFVEKLLEFIEDGKDIETVNARGRTALHIAAMVGNTNTAQLLVQKKKQLTYIKDASKRYASKRYWSKWYRSKRFDCKRYWSKRFASKQFASKRYASKQYTSKRFTSKRYGSKHYGSKHSSSINEKKIREYRLNMSAEFLSVDPT
ncbi:putative ankyrin repeat-containing domain-containing protein [Helianthus anomalus]